MGVVKQGYSSIHSLLEGDFGECTTEHTVEADHQFWRLSFRLAPRRERQADEVSIGRLKNVRSTIRLTREK